MKNILKMLTFVSLFAQYAQLYPVNTISGCTVYGNIEQNVYGGKAEQINYVNGNIVQVDNPNMITIEESGNKETKQLDITDIRNLMVSNVGHLTLHQCLECPEILTIIADKKIMPLLQQKKQGKDLTLQMKDNTAIRFTGNSKDLVKYHATVKDIQELILSGLVSGETLGKITTDDLKIDLLGSSQMDASIEAKKLSARLVGAAQVNIDGNVSDQKIDVLGSAQYNALNLVSKNTDIDLMGAASAQVYSTESTKYSAFGASDLECAGPGQVKGTKLGAARVRKI